MNLKLYIESFKDILKNFSYTLSYQILSLILPLITVPYITRVMSQELVGTNTVLQNNCYYFVIVGMLGISYLGPREIAKCLGNIKTITVTFNNIYRIQFFTHFISIVLYTIYCYFAHLPELAYMYLLYLVSSMFDISWLFIGIEDFKNIAIRNIIVRICSFLLLILFVKADDDVNTYVCTLYIPQIIMNAYMWGIFYIRFYVNYRRFKTDRNQLSLYLKESLSLFLPQVAANIYTALDKTILGMMTTYSLTAIYSQGQNLLRLFLAVVPSFCKVMVPRIASCIEKKADQEIYKYMKMSADVIGFISFLLCFGVMGCSRLFVSWYLPAEYSETATVMIICAPIIVLVSGANLISIQFLIPLGKQRIYTISVFIATAINLVLNITLTPILGIYGVCVGSVAAEAIGLVVQIYYARKYISLTKIFKNLPIFLFAGIGTYFITREVSSHLNVSFLSILEIAIIGLLSFSVMTYLFIKITNKVFDLNYKKNV